MFNNNYKLIITFICLILILGIIVSIFQSQITQIDEIGYQIISKLISEKTLPITKFITSFGSSICLLFFSIFLFIIIKDKRIGFCIFINLFLSGALNQILKNIFKRPRPTGYRLIAETGYSFPSGHSMVSLAFYGLLIYIIYKKIKNIYLRNSLIVLLIILTISIGISRIFLGVHYTTDVIAGFLISICYLIVFTNVLKRCIINKDSTKEE